MSHRENFERPGAGDRASRGLWCGVCVVLLAVGGVQGGRALQRTSGATQRSGSTQVMPSTSPDYSATRPALGSSSDTLEERAGLRDLDEKRGKMMNSERQKMMVKEAGQLVQMTADLQFSLSQKPGGLASEQALKQVDLVEKLARNVKERMKGGR